nr:MAG TPA: hypothetical protein [Microviridae sp.]
MLFKINKKENLSRTVRFIRRNALYRRAIFLLFSYLLGCETITFLRRISGLSLPKHISLV